MAAHGVDLSARLDARVARRVPALCAAISAAFAFFCAVTLATRPVGATIALAIIDGAGALAFLAAALTARRGGVPRRAANGAAAAALLVTLAASLAAIKLLHLPAQSTNLLILELVGSIILLSARWNAALIAATLAGWGLVMWTEGVDEAWLNASFALVAASLMSWTVQHVRLRDARRAEALLAENEAKAASLEAFAFVISHDLKEPIRATGIFLSDALASADKAERDELLGRARSSHEQLARLVDGLLGWSRLASTPVRPEPLDLHALLQDATTRAQFGQALAERRAKLLVEPGLPLVLATEPLARQILGNLILNAVKHNPREGPQVRVYAAPDAPRGKVDLVVEDNGPGFPPELLGQRPRDAPRTIKRGFGMEIARRATELLGGELHVQNLRDGGAAVHVLLPAAKRPSARPEPAGGAPRTRA
ncbi:MAG TPA: HAMP domain-containing sensor histidine kinase [Candidatus Thermoplasmatota archaeon]|nr:HAMP domain-containing sensor histidine kinase [Candidatus Thermoplasmatota archaeon]